MQMCWGWALGAILAPGGQALSAPLSLCSVLDDEGSNLRQQKLDRQVSGAGARWRRGQHLPSVRVSKGPFLGWPRLGVGEALTEDRQALSLPARHQHCPRTQGFCQAGSRTAAGGALDVCVGVLPGQLPGLTYASFPGPSLQAPWPRVGCGSHRNL